MAQEQGHRSRHLRGSRALLVAAISLLLLATGWVVFSRVRAQHARRADVEARRRSADAGPVVAVARVTTTPVDRTITLPADVRAIQQTTIYAKVSGYLSRILVDRGARVERGQLLASIASPETDQQLLSARADLNNARRAAARARTLAPAIHCTLRR